MKVRADDIQKRPKSCLGLLIEIAEHKICAQSQGTAHPGGQTRLDSEIELQAHDGSRDFDGRRIVAGCHTDMRGLEQLNRRIREEALCLIEVSELSPIRTIPDGQPTLTDIEDAASGILMWNPSTDETREVRQLAGIVYEPSKMHDLAESLKLFFGWVDKVLGER